MPFIKVRDNCGQEISVEVTQEVYQLFEEERKANARYLRSCKRHIDNRALEDYILPSEAYSLPYSAEDSYFSKEELRRIYEVVRTCTAVQQERFFLYFVCGYTFEEIGQMLNRHGTSVQESINTVLKKIKNIF